MAEVRQAAADEIGRLWSGLLRTAPRFDLEASELFLRDSLHAVGGRVLEGVLKRLSGAAVGEVKCAAGHPAALVDYRSKQLTTVLGEIAVKRAYYYCDECAVGLLPQDRQWDIEDTSFSPGVRRMMGHVGGKQSFKGGRVDLEALAGIKVQTKAVERVAEALGAEIEAWGKSQRQQAMRSQIVPLKSGPLYYVSIDGTGVPVIKRETAGRRGKGENGEARMREAKLGCIFTQTSTDKDGHPQRDEATTTYVGAIEAAAEFGWRIYGEAERRGSRRARQVVVLGDGAQWIWNIAAEHFPEAVQIVDLYHAREYLADLRKLIYGPKTNRGGRWLQERLAQLDEGRVAAVLFSLRRLRPTNTKAQEELRRTIKYFENNRERMRYRDFRRQGWFVGSGVVEAGCRTVIAQRLKQSGMHWSVSGANKIIALRCLQLSGRWEAFWEMRAAS